MKYRSRAKVATLRLWETEVIFQSGYSEDQWSDLPLRERARKLIAYKLSDWISGLDARYVKR